MRRFITLAALLTVCHSVSFGQAPEIISNSSSLNPAHYTAADTLRAIRHLFLKRLKGAVNYMGTGGGLLIDAAVTTGLQSATGVEGQQTDINQDVFVGSALLGYGLFRFQRYSPTQYKLIVVSYANGQPLPPYIRRRLKRKFFRYDLPDQMAAVR